MTTSPPPAVRSISGSFLATIPLLVLFVFVGRRLVRGIMEGAFKG